MEIIHGTAAFSGISIGKIKYYQQSEESKLDTSAELSLLHVAEDQLFQELLMQTVMEEEQIEELTLLKSASFQKALDEMIVQERVRASYALVVTTEEIIRTFGGLEAPFIRRKIHALGQISGKLQAILEENSRKKAAFSGPSIVVARSLTPAQIVGMEKENLIAIITQAGSEIAHASIVAKEREIPILVDIEVDSDWENLPAIVDGYTGTLYLDPDAETLETYQKRRQEMLQEKEALLRFRNAQDVTKSGKQVKIYANIGSLADLESVRYYGASGIGLFRSEFQYLGRKEYPGEEDLFLQYKKVAEFMGEKPCIIRTVDLGADKQSPYMNIPAEVNPIMGNRGIRFCLDHKEIIRNQLRAIYRAGIYGNLMVLYPMVTSLEEMQALHAIETEVREELRERKVPFFDNMRTGIMIETPAAVMIARELAREADFLSIGTNDLTQYTLAMDKQNPELKEKYQDHHPAVLRMIEMVVKGGHQENSRVMICGELASDLTLTEHFLNMGIDALSVVPSMVLPVRKQLREL